MLHDLAPGLGTLKDRDATGTGAGNFRVVIMGGGGADDQLGVPQVFGAVADMDLDAQGTQMRDCTALPDVGAGDGHPHAVEHFGQRSHRYAANAHQVGAAVRGQIRGNIKVSHRHTTFL